MVDLAVGAFNDDTWYRKLIIFPLNLNDDDDGLTDKAPDF